MRLCSIILFILSAVVFNEVTCLNKLNYVKNFEKKHKEIKEVIYDKKIPQKEQLNLFGCAAQFCNGVNTAVYDNLKYILKSFIYPIESIVRVFGFCKRVSLKVIKFIVYPKPDHVYAEILDKKMAKIINFFANMSMAEKLKWFGYVTTDFFIGYYAPYGLGWKLVSLTRNTVISIKSLKYFELLNKTSTIDHNILRMVNNRNANSLMNIKYGFEYADQFKQYLNDIVRHDAH